MDVLRTVYRPQVVPYQFKLRYVKKKCYSSSLLHIYWNKSLTTLFLCHHVSGFLTSSPVLTPGVVLEDPFSTPLSELLFLQSLMNLPTNTVPRRLFLFSHVDLETNKSLPRLILNETFLNDQLSTTDLKNWYGTLPCYQD